MTIHGSMLTYYHKEWRENRQNLVWIPAVVAILVATAAIYNLSILTERRAEIVDGPTAEGALAFIWGMSAVLCGSSLVAPEIGSGTFQFLSALPISRRRIWFAKVAAGFLSMSTCVALSTSACLAVYSTAACYGAFSYPLKSMTADFKANGLEMLCLDVTLFSISLLMTVLLDSTINAVIATIIVGAIVGALIVGFADAVPLQPKGAQYEQMVLATLAIPIFMSMSYQTYLHGETLKTSKRFMIAIPGALFDVALIAATISLCVYWMMS